MHCCQAGKEEYEEGFMRKQAGAREPALHMPLYHEHVNEEQFGVAFSED